MSDKQPDPNNRPHFFIELPDGSVASPDQINNQDRNNFEAQLPLTVLQKGDVVGFQFVHQGKPGGITFDVTSSTWTGLGINEGKPSKTILGTLEGDLVPEIAKGKTALCMGSFAGGASIMDGVLSTGHEPAFRVSGDIMPQDVRLPSINGFTIARQKDGHLEMLEPQALESDHPEIREIHVARINDMVALTKQFGIPFDPRDNTTNYGLGIHNQEQGDFRVDYSPGKSQGNRLSVFDYSTGQKVEYYYDPGKDVIKVAYMKIEGEVNRQTLEGERMELAYRSTGVTYVSSVRFGLNLARVSLGEQDIETSLGVPSKTLNGRFTALSLNVQPDGSVDMSLTSSYAHIEDEQPGSHEKARRQVQAAFREDGGLDLQLDMKQVRFPSPHDISAPLLKQQ